MTFDDIMRIANATMEERDKCAWFLAMMRAKKIYEELRQVRRRSLTEERESP